MCERPAPLYRYCCQISYLPLSYTDEKQIGIKIRTLKGLVCSIPVQVALPQHVFLAFVYTGF